MRYIFIIQGEGRGHLTQALTVSDILRRNGHTLVEVLVGVSNERDIPDFFIQKIGCPTLRFVSPNFVMSKNRKNVDLLRTITQNLTLNKGKTFARSIRLIKDRVREGKADVVINFYELLGSLATLGNGLKGVKMVGIAHQYLLQHSEFHYDKRGKRGLSFLRLHAAMSAIGLSRTLALSFYPLAPSRGKEIHTIPPMLRKEVLNSTVSNGDHILGYMLNEGYAEEIYSWHDEHPDVRLHIFWDKRDAPETMEVDPTLTFHKINDTKFLELMASCRGYITTAGFESVCEALYLGKPCLMIPAHIEQKINACDAMKVGAGVSSVSFDISKLLDLCQSYTANRDFAQWVDNAEARLLDQLADL